MSMTHANVTFRREEIENVGCPCCGKPMNLSCISAGSEGYDLRTFDCEQCRRSKSIVVHIDPDGSW